MSFSVSLEVIGKFRKPRRGDKNVSVNLWVRGSYSRGIPPALTLPNPNPNLAWGNAQSIWKNGLEVEFLESI
jgi:hypothetical protein